MHLNVQDILNSVEVVIRVLRVTYLRKEWKWLVVVGVTDKGCKSVVKYLLKFQWLSVAIFTL